jgi:MFS family permease
VSLVDESIEPRERRALLAAAALRALATGMAGVLLGIYLAKVGLSPKALGQVAGAGLAGAAAGALAVTLWGRRWEPRRALLLLGLAGALGGGLLAVATRPPALAAAAFLGMVNAMGRDRGPAYVLEQALLPASAAPARRTLAFAWYTALQDAGHAVGSLAAGLPALLAAALPLDEPAAFRLSIALYALLLGGSALPYLWLSPGRRPGVAHDDPTRPDTAHESPARASLRGDSESRPGSGPHAADPVPRRPPPGTSPASRRILARICLLFSLDGLGGGFLTTALLSYFFFERFGVDPAAVGALFFAGRVANVLSHLGAAWLAARIGLVNTMVWTHLPSSLLLVGAALAPTFTVAAALFVLREALVEMDVPTRQSYVMAMVRPAERAAASGVTNLMRLGTWALGPGLAGWLMGGLALGAPLIAGAGLKIVYDLLLYASFRRLRPPEER